MIPTDHLQSQADIKAAIVQGEAYRQALRINLNQVNKKLRKPIDYEDLEFAICMERSRIEYFQENVKTATDPTKISVLNNMLAARKRKLARMTLKEKRRGRERMTFYIMQQGVYETQLQVLNDYLEGLKGKLEG